MNKIKALIIALLLVSLTSTTYASSQCGNQKQEYECVHECDSSDIKELNSDGTCDEEDGYKKQSKGGSLIDNLSMSHIHFGVDYKVELKTEGCAPCGAKSSRSSVPVVGFMRYHRMRNVTEHSSFGPGIFSNWDVSLKLFTQVENGETVNYIDFFAPQKTFAYRLSHNSELDPNGTFYDNTFASISDLKLFDQEDNQVSSIEDAHIAVLTTKSKITVIFEVFSLIDGTRAGRLISIVDLKGYSLDISYAYSVNAELVDPTEKYQMAIISDPQGRKIMVDYNEQKKNDKWVISKITLPNSSEITYSYGADVTGRLESVNYPDGTQSTFSSTVIAEGETVISYFEAGEKGIERKKDAYMTSNFSFTNVPGGIPFQNEASLLVRKITKGEVQEVTYDTIFSADGKKRFIYEGGGLVKTNNVGHEAYYVTWQLDEEKGIQGSREKIFGKGTFSDNVAKRKNLVSSLRSRKGITVSYQYNDLKHVTRKTYSDGTYEEFLYNDAQLTTYERDRLGRVTLKSYNTQNNLTKIETGWVEIDGELVKTDDFAVETKSYFPATHRNKFLLRTEKDANGNVTKYFYNADNLLVKVTTPDDTGSKTAAAVNKVIYAYDTAKRLKSSTDAEGRKTEFSYDTRDRISKIAYNDTSTELFFYGTGANANLLIKKKDRNGNTTKFEYDDLGRAKTTTRAYSIMSVNGNSETVNPTSLQSVERCTYLDGTTLKASCTIDGNLVEYFYDYRNRLIETRRHADADSVLITSKTYIDNKVFSEEDPYGRKTFYSYRPEDARLIRSIRGLLPSYSLNNFDDVDAEMTGDGSTYLLTKYELDAEGQRSAVVDPRGIRQETDYDSKGRLSFRVNAAGSLNQTTQYIYDANSNLIEQRNPRYFSESINDIVTMTYGNRNKLASRTVAPETTAAATESFTYHVDGKTHTHTDFRGNTSSDEWHKCCGRIEARIDQLGHANVIINDFYGNITHSGILKAYNGAGGIPEQQSAHDLNNSKTLQETTTRFDSRHRPTAKTIWLKKLGPVDANNVPIATNPQDGLTTYYYYYDDLNHSILTPLVSELANDGVSFTSDQGSAVIIVNPEGEASIVIKDGVGRTVAQGAYDKTDYANGTYTLVTWSSVVHDTITTDGLLETKQVSALGFENTSKADGAGRVLENIDAEGNSTTFAYDANSNRVSFTDPNGTGIDCIFDDLNRDTLCEDREDAITRKVFDLNNNLIAEYDAKDQITTYAYDERNRRVKTVDRIDAETTFTYDENNNLKTVKDALGKVTKYAYDKRNQKTSTTYPDHIVGSKAGDIDYGITKQTYDPLRRQSVSTDQLGEKVVRQYDMASRMKKRLYKLKNNSLESTDTFTYDLASRPLTAKKGRYGNTVTYTYDGIGRQKTETLSLTGSAGSLPAASFTTECFYDADNRVTSCQYPNGYILAKTYTDRNQLETVSFNAGSIVDFTYDSGNRELKRTFANNFNSKRIYKLDNTLKEIQTKKNNYNRKVLSFNYTYDLNKNVESETVQGAVSDYSWNAVFDEADRLETWNRTGNTGNIHSQAWNLDLIGNWGSVTTDGVIENRDHNDVHELVSISGSADSLSALTYDSKGNLKTLPGDTGGLSVSSLTWDLDNHLTSFDKDGDITNFTYDALGRRVSKDNTLFVSHGQRVIEEYTLDLTTENYSLSTSYIHGTYVDDILAQVTPNTASGSPVINYYHIDRQFNVRGLTNESGGIVQLYAYTPYGKRTGMKANGTLVTNPDNLKTNYGFTGRYHDQETNLWYFRARYFSNELGRFISRDPLGYVDGYGLYGAYFAQRFELDPSGTRIGGRGSFVRLLLPLYTAIILGSPDVTENGPETCDDPHANKRCLIKEDGILWYVIQQTKTNVLGRWVGTTILQTLIMNSLIFTYECRCECPTLQKRVIKDDISERRAERIDGDLIKSRSFEIQYRHFRKVCGII